MEQCWWFRDVFIIWCTEGQFMSHFIGNGSLHIRNEYFIFVCVIYRTCNKIGDSGACSLSSALEINSSLTLLDLRVTYPMSKMRFTLILFVRNNIGELGICSIQSALEVNSTVISIRLEECFFPIMWESFLFFQVNLCW